jgi:prepilin signal peptidase PulO-like enzyme (type II secretory pathway)
MLLARVLHEWNLIIPAAVSALLASWFFAVGSCVGSFINVVALRMPVGMGIVRRGSRCPKCLHAIRWYDNIPLLSWLNLGGRCRRCGAWISVRYPLVELCVALLFLVLALAEGFAAGGNLPPPADAARYFVWTPWQVWSFYSYHLVLLVTLFTVSLIAWDDREVPFAVLLPGLVVGLLAPIVCPWLHPVPGWPVAGLPVLSRIASPLLGMLVGGLMGWSLWPAFPRDVRAGRPPRQVVFSAALCGMFLGWQAVMLVVVAATLGYLVLSRVASCSPLLCRGPWSLYLTVSAVLLITRWESVVEYLPWFGAESSLGFVPLSAALVLLAAGATRRITRTVVPPSSTPAVEGNPVMPTLDPDQALEAILESPSYLAGRI